MPPSLAALLGFLLAAYGLANAVAVLDAGLPLRKITGRIPAVGRLFSCPACLSFWVGILLSVLFFSPLSGLCSSKMKGAFADGLMASGFSYLAHSVMERLWRGAPETGPAHAADGKKTG